MFGGNNNIGINLLTMILGVVITLVIQEVQDRLVHYDERSLEGWWLQCIEGSPSHPYSVAQFRFDDQRKILTFDGKNFDREGNFTERWTTVSSQLNSNDKKFYYMYNFSTRGENIPSYYGSGIMELKVESKRKIYLIFDRLDYAPTTGSFSSIPLNDSRLDYTMKKLPYRIVKQIEDDYDESRIPSIGVIFSEIFPNSSICG